MRFIPRNKIDIERWNQLVSEDEATPCDYSWFLDAVAENWYVYVSDEYSKGIAFTTKTNLGVENVVVAPYVRQNRFYGVWSSTEMEAFVSSLQKKFKGGIFQTDKKISSHVRTCQILQDAMELSTHAKRNLKKAEKNHLFSRITDQIEPSFSLMKDELSVKIKSFDTFHQAVLLQLLQNLQKNDCLIIREIVMDDKVLGGLFFFRGKERILFLKGSATPEGKKLGGMYLAMLDQIKETLSQKLLFDFDGSEVPGVQRFNEYFGAENSTYYQIQWDNNPFWYRLIKKLYLKLK